MAESAAITGQKRIWLRRAATTLGALGSGALLFGVAAFSLSSLLVRPRLKRLSQLRSHHLKNLIRRIGIDFEEVVIPSFDGTRLQGWWMMAGERAGTVVVLHGVKKNRTDVIRTVLVLRQAGFNVLVFDGRAHGHSEGKFVTYGFFERRDVESVIDWLVSQKKVDGSRIGLAGESMGAAIALQVAVVNPWVKAVWADSPFASLRRVAGEYVQRITGLPGAILNPVLWTTIQVAGYRGRFDVGMVDPLSLAARIKCPVFIVHGTADQLIDTAHSQNIYDALGGKRQLWLVEGARHARAARHFKQDYSLHLTRFFDEQLSEPEQTATQERS